MKMSWSFVFLGALVALSIWMWMIFVGAVFAFIGLGLSLFIGGAVAALQMENRQRFHAALYGVAVWGVTVFFFALLSATAVVQASAGVGATIGAKAIASEIGRLNPRVVSDVKILKGKIVSYLVVNDTEKDTTESRRKLEEAATQLRRATAAASLFLAGALARHLPAVITEEFIADVLAVDFTRPVFSTTRCALLPLVPARWSATWENEFRENLRSSNLPGAAALLANLTAPEKTTAHHQARAERFLERCEQRLRTRDGALDLARYLGQTRAEIAASEISKNPRGQILEPGFRVIFPVLNPPPSPWRRTLNDECR